MTLPAYKIVEREEGGWIKVQCPRKDCRGHFKVKARAWAESRPAFTGRSCPYCFKANGLPKRKS